MISLNRMLKSTGLMLAITILLEPDFIKTLPTVDTIYNILQIIVSIIVLIIYLTKMDSTRFAFFLFIMQGIIILSTLFHHGDLKTCFLQTCYIVPLCVLCELYMRKDSVLLLQAFSIVLGIYAHINLITYLLFPDGLYINHVGSHNCWFLGYDNTAMSILLPAICISIYHSVMLSKRVSLWCCSVVISSVSFTLVTWVATGVVAMAILLIALLIYCLNKKLPSYKLCISINIIAFILLVFFNITSRLSVLTDLLGKSNTLSGRTILWERLMPLFQRNWLCGNGVLDVRVLKNISGFQWAVHTHNYYYEILIYGGVIALICFFSILFISASWFDNHMNEKKSNIIKMGVFSYLLICQVEKHGLTVTLFVLLVISYHIDSVEKCYSVSQKRSRRSIRRPKMNLKYRGGWIT